MKVSLKVIEDGDDLKKLQTEPTVMFCYLMDMFAHCVLGSRKG